MHVHPPYYRENGGHALTVMSYPHPLDETVYAMFRTYLEEAVMDGAVPPPEDAGQMQIRTAAPGDLDALAALEAACFPSAEAADRETLAGRLAAYPQHFWLLFDGARLVSFVDGMMTDQRDLTDVLYENASLHDENGAWQMIFGVNTHPDYRRRGCAGIQCAGEKRRTAPAAGKIR